MPMLTNLRQQLRDSTQRISNHARAMSTACINALWQRITSTLTAILQWFHSSTRRIRDSVLWKQIKPQLHDFFKLSDAHIYETWKILLEAVKVIAGFIFIFALFLLLSAAISMPRECTELHLVCRLFGVEDKATALRYLGFVMAGILSFAGIVIAHERSQAMADTAKASYEAVKATTAGQQQERFRDAIAHLGRERASVRQGGAHALFHLALDEERLRASIAEILCAYIRETTQSKDYQKAYEDKPSTEIQSLLELLFVERESKEESEKLDAFWKGITPNLMGCYFRGIELKVDRFFCKADLRYAQFQDAFLGRAQFQGALLAHAQFQGAYLGSAQFQGADLSNAQFQGADLTHAQFQKAWLRGAEFKGAKLRGAQFQGACLGESQFQGASLDDVQFQSADLKNAQFQGVFQAAGGYTRCCEKWIRERIDCESELNSVVFSGGLDDNQVEKLVDGLKKVLEVSVQNRATEFAKFTEEYIEIFKAEMKEHVGKPKSHTPPDGVITGKYSRLEAEKWIEECPAACAQQIPESGEDS